MKLKHKFYTLAVSGTAFIGGLLGNMAIGHAIVINGGFEQPVISSLEASVPESSVPGWEAGSPSSGDAIDIKKCGYFGICGANGTSQFADVFGNTSILYQDVTTTTGTWMDFSFFYNFPQSGGMRVSLIDLTRASTFYTNTFWGSNGTWLKHLVSIQTQGIQTRILFEAFGNNIFIDEVSFTPRTPTTPVPEPLSIGTIFGGSYLMWMKHKQKAKSEKVG